MTMLEVIQERAGDIEFAHEARRIYDQIARLTKKRMWSVLKPNGTEPILDRWNGVHVSLPELGVTDVPDILQDLVIVFAWGTPDAPLSGAAFMPPHELYPSGIIVLAYNIGKPDRQPFKISRSAKRARAKLRHITKNTEVLEDEDVIQFVPQLMDARRTAFIHELRHAYDQLVRDDDGQMDDYMAKSTKPSNEETDEENFAKNFTSDDEMNAYITQGMEDTIEDFLKNTRNKPTKAKAQKWAPNGTALWNRFLGNVAGAVKHYNGEEKLMKRAAARVADVWDDYVQTLNEGKQPLTEAFKGMEIVRCLPKKGELDGYIWGLKRNDKIIAGAGTTIEDGWDVILTLWSDTAQGAYALMMTIMYEAQKGIVPDGSCTEAAQSIISRWYEKHQDDPQYVVQNPLNRIVGEDFINAGYLAGPAVKSVAPVRDLDFDISSDHQEWKDVNYAVTDGFDEAYEDPERTNRVMGPDRLLKLKRWDVLHDTLVDMARDGKDVEAGAWLSRNLDKIESQSNTPYFNALNLKALKRDLPMSTETHNESRIVEGADDDIQDAIEELMDLPEFKTLDAFVEMKFDDEEEHYGTIELQALARNLYLADNKQLRARDLASAPSSYRDKVKKELEGYGLLFSPRKTPKVSRGFSSPINGSNRFAGNHGGSGFTNAYNREPSSGRTFDPNDDGALGMGSKRKK